MPFKIQKEIMDFLDDLRYQGINVIYENITFEPSEIQELIAKQTQIGETLYKKVELLYNLAQEAQGKNKT